MRQRSASRQQQETLEIPREFFGLGKCSRSRSARSLLLLPALLQHGLAERTTSDGSKTSFTSSTSQVRLFKLKRCIPWPFLCQPKAASIRGESSNDTIEQGFFGTPPLKLRGWIFKKSVKSRQQMSKQAFTLSQLRVNIASTLPRRKVKLPSSSHQRCQGLSESVNIFRFKIANFPSTDICWAAVRPNFSN